MKTINSLRSKLLTLTLALMASVSSFAYDFTFGNDFHIDGFAYKIISRTNPCSVALIEVADCEKHVAISESVTYNDSTFIVTTLGMGNMVFSGTARNTMESIYIPKTIMIVNYRALGDCPNLKSIVVDEENKYLDSRNNCNAIISSNDTYRPANQLVAGCKTTVIPNSVTEIGNYAFVRCETLENIIIPEGVTRICDGAFYECTSLSSIKLPESLTHLTQQWIFGGCTNLKEVFFFAKTPPYIAYGMFNGITPTIYVPKESLDAYKKALYWQNFDIQAIPYTSQWCNQWNILAHGYLGPQEPLYGAKTTIYQLGEDTIINHLSYKQLTRYASDDVNQTKTYVGAIRFAKNNRQVYFYYDNAEYLLYDFKAQVGDTLEVFAGIDNYRDHKTYKHVVTNKEPIQDEQCKVTLDVFVQQELDGEIIHEEKFTSIWIEGVGSPDGIVHNCATLREGNVVTDVLCAYVDDRRMYRTPYPDYRILGCEYNEGDFIEGAFPILSGLQRTVCNEYCGDTEDDNSANFTYKQTFDSIFFENDKPYIFCNGYLLREEDNKIFLYSQSLNKDIVLYDFTLEVGDSLPAYIKDFDGTMYSDDTLVVTDISSVTLLDGKEYKKWTFDNGKEYVEGIGMYGGRRNGDFFGLIQEVVVPCHIGTHLVCVSKNGELLYQMDEAEMERLGAECLCEAENPEDLFPTLWGLQRTGCTKTIGENENGTVWGSRSYLMQEIETATIDGKQYLLFGTNNIYDEYCSLWLREENNKILVYSTTQKKDLVLYDFTLNVGDSLSRLYVDYELSSVVDYDNDEWGLAPLVVTEVSAITLLDGKEHKKWTFNNGMQYVEGIGSFGTCYAHNDFYQLIANAPLYSDVHSQHLVCVSKNNKLLYQMDPVKMDELGAECLCDYDRGPRKDNAKDGQIGGRPTPTQWNQLEVVLRQMDNNHTILQAETFSYTLEDISQQVNNKTYFQLARQSTKDTATTKSVVGALHFGKDEDNRVYFLRDGVEYVLYDFTAEIGDTVEIFAGINNYPQETTYTHVVVDKDTTEDGACRMFLEVVFPEETTTAENAEKVWLAGLGSVDGIVHNAAKRTSNAHAAPSRSASSETESSVMLCAWREDSCLYTTNHPDYETFGCIYNQDPTSVEDISTSQSSYQKIIREGQFLILHNGKTYSVMGIEL